MEKKSCLLFNSLAYFEQEPAGQKNFTGVPPLLHYTVGVHVKNPLFGTICIYHCSYHELPKSFVGVSIYRQSHSELLEFLERNGFDFSPDDLRLYEWEIDDKRFPVLAKNISVNDFEEQAYFAKLDAERPKWPAPLTARPLPTELGKLIYRAPQGDGWLMSSSILDIAGNSNEVDIRIPGYGIIRLQGVAQMESATIWSHLIEIWQYQDSGEDLSRFYFIHGDKYSTFWARELVRLDM